jgi:hypothetical protein
MDTTPRSSRKGLSPSRTRLSLKSGARTALDRRRTWIVVTVVSAVIVAGLGYLVWKVFFDSPKRPSRRHALLVNKEGQAGEFKTIKEALDRAVPGDHIVVTGGEYEEQIVLRNRRGITIEKGEGQVVVVPPAKYVRGPLLEVSYSEKILIKHIKFNGQGKVKTLVSLAGNCPHVVLDELNLTNYPTLGTAVQITNCAGEKENNVQLLRLKTTPQDPKTPGPAIIFRLNPKVLPPLNDHIHIKDCQFIGGYNFKTSRPIVFDKKQLGSDVILDGKPLLEVSNKR